MTFIAKGGEIRFHICGCCEQEKPIVGVASVPGVPLSIAWCSDCLKSGAIPYDVAVANTACCGGLDQCNEAWRAIVDATLHYFKKSLDEFTADVQADIKAMQEFDDA